MVSLIFFFATGNCPNDFLQPKIRFIRSQKKNAQLVYKNFIFNKKITQINGHTTWRCAEMAKIKCRALLTTKSGHLIRTRECHNHPDHQAKLLHRLYHDVENDMDEVFEIKSSELNVKKINIVDMGNRFKLVLKNATTSL